MQVREPGVVKYNPFDTCGPPTYFKSFYFSKSMVGQGNVIKEQPVELQPSAKGIHPTS